VAEVSENTIKAARRGERLQKRVISRLNAALNRFLAFK
jgi:hypothetical protein